MKNLVFCIIYTIAEGTYWEQPFENESGDYVYKCHGYDSQNNTKTEDNEFCKEYCDEENTKDAAIPLKCQLHCQVTRPRNNCFKSDGSLNTTVNSSSQRFCTFSIQMVKAKSDKFFKFPEKPKERYSTCEADQQSCGFIQRDCLHVNKAHDQENDCVIKAFYCAFEHSQWLERFGINKSSNPDCLSLTVENFYYYLFDIPQYGLAANDNNTIHRWFVCVCDYPFNGEPGFMDCKKNLDLIFSQILNSTKSEQCDYVNSPNILGAYTTGGSKHNNDVYELCKTYDKYEDQPSTSFIVLLVVLCLTILIVTIGVSVSRKMNRSTESNTWYSSDKDTGVTEITTTTALITSNEGKLLEIIDGSVETKVIPKIKSDFEARIEGSGLLSKSTILHAGFDLTLETILKCRKINSANYLMILIDISWWLMELHGENKSWKVFFASMDPRKIGIIRNDSSYRAFIMGYDMAQDIAKLSNGQVTIPGDSNSVNRQYQPPELINLTERNEARSVLSADVYGFACIAWKVLRVISDETNAIDPTEDPFDREIAALSGQDSVYSAMKLIFQDYSKRPSFGRINKDKYSHIMKIIEECWCIQPSLRLTSAQLYSRLLALSQDGVSF